MLMGRFTCSSCCSILNFFLFHRVRQRNVADIKGGVPERANIIVFSNSLNMQIWDVVVAVIDVLWELNRCRRRYWQRLWLQSHLRR